MWMWKVILVLSSTVHPREEQTQWNQIVEHYIAQQRGNTETTDEIENGQKQYRQ